MSEKKIGDVLEGPNGLAVCTEQNINDPAYKTIISINELKNNWDKSGVKYNDLPYAPPRSKSQSK